MSVITKDEAKVFILRKQGLIGKHKYFSEKGILDYVKQVGCLQFDPLDICGRNADLVLFSRIANYGKEMLENLLYRSRELVDQWDKNMSIYAVSDWPKLSRIRQMHAIDYETRLSGSEEAIDKVKAILSEKESVQTNDLDIMSDSTFYRWRSKKLSQTILDYLFFKGDALIHHRDGVKRFFGETKKYLKKDIIDLEDPFKTMEDFQKFQIKRRIGALGILSSGSSDAYLGVYGFNAAKRRKYFDELARDGKIIKIVIEGLKDDFYILKEDEELLTPINVEKRLEFIAPLDNFLWDRKQINKIFTFAYTWEIYMKKENRKYGAYVMPILYGNDLVGRIEITVDRKNSELVLKNLWFENLEVDSDFWLKFDEKVKCFLDFNNVHSINKSTFKIFN
ncbi:MAG: crosslink repair DNA glycosylase YcaQ family protein [Bacilli bacterium]|nr:crosslink repair DNA glycosylase YcaQ family protein [Bacilli bacterium]